MKNKLLDLLSSIESEVLELKEAKRQFDTDKLGRYFSALSNEANLKSKSQAWLLLGVNDSKTIVGTAISDKQLNSYKVEIAKNTSPAISFIAIHKISIEKKTVLMLEIPAAPNGMPVSWKGHYYGRDGESLGALNIAEIEKIRKQATLYDWSAQIIKGATIDDLSTEAIELARKQFIVKNPKFANDISNWDVLKFLNKAKIAIKGQITNTTILLLGKSESEHFISPAIAKISWILKDKENIEKDYEHFSCPFLLNVQKVYSKIRNLKYRYLQKRTIFPDEVDQYDPFIIREALNNCIAHQDYQLAGKINIVEREDGILIFDNMGKFIPESIENVIISDAPESQYQNPFLANAMVNLNMIDTIGSGIKKMFVIQKDKYFPLPDYDLSNDRVKVTITGKIVDVNYAIKLATIDDLSLNEIFLLDKVAKGKSLLDNEIKQLRIKKLIEGRKPNLYISSTVAIATNEKSNYIKMKGIEDDYAQTIIIEYLSQFNKAKRSDLEDFLMEKLPDVLTLEQKKNKIKNILQKLKKEKKIFVDGKYWEMSKP